eukprot:TRINITY_DN6374_c0_g1_i1.p1 TRINITY_DN6374_c0_g1~~TRINITY_DN6374_c0_g1_i1.p1  ORF type:complete len:206 (+),score=38.24 TRINITY_DN6374_c0_g1_i1:27-644(+)
MSSEEITISDEQINTDQTPKKKRKKNLFSDAKRGIASKAAGSKAGEGLINKFLDSETKDMINAIRDITRLESGDEAAKIIKKDIYKIAVKMILLYQDKVITKEDFIRLRGQFKRMCAALRNGYRTGTLEEDTAVRITDLAIVFFEDVKSLLDGAIKNDTMERVERLGGTLGDLGWLLMASQYAEEFGRIVLACAHYLDLLAQRGR